MRGLAVTLVALGGWWGVLTGVARAEGVTFAKPALYTVGSNPVDIAVGDLNRDGRLDLVTADNSGDSVSVLLGRGDGTFTQRGPYSVPGSGPGAVAIGDFTGDGKPDVAMLTLGDPKEVAVFPGKGDGTLGAASPHSPTLNAYGLALATADINHDGHPDIIAATSTGTGDIEVFLSNGDGTFTAKPSLTVPNVTSLAVGDVNGDHIPDIVAGADNGLVVLLGNGNGTFGAAHGYSSTTPVGWVTLGDFNGDGHQDVALATNAGAPAIGIALGVGNGALNDPVMNGIASTYDQVAAGDMFSNGRLDPVAVSHHDNKLSVFYGNGDGSLSTEADTSVTTPWSVAIGDFNRDGNPDVAVADGNDGQVLVYLSTPPAATVSTASLGFAARQLGSGPLSKAVTLTNVESIKAALPDVRVSHLQVSGPAARDFTVTGCSAPVLGGHACQLTVAFRPTAVGSRTATLTVTDNAAGRTQTVSLRGTGRAPTCSVKPPTLTRTAIMQRRLPISAQCSGPARLSLRLVIAGQGKQLISGITMSFVKPGTVTGAITFSRPAARLLTHSPHPRATLHVAEVVAAKVVRTSTMSVVVKR